MFVEKMHECGNDYAIVMYEDDIDFSNLAKKICNRRIGIGADGLIVVKIKPLEMILYTPEGQIDKMCASGIRCFTKYCYMHLIVKKKFSLILGLRKIKVEITSTDPFRCFIDYGVPNFKNQMLYVSDVIDCFGRAIKVNDSMVMTYSVYLDGVNTIVFVNSFDDPALKYASDISNHKLFNRKTNVSFVRIIDQTTIAVKTYDNIRGWVLCSDGGCIAASVCAYEAGFVKDFINVELEYGSLMVQYCKNAVLIGSAVKVFETDFEEEEIC